MPFTYLGFAFGYNKACHPGIHTIIIIDLAAQNKALLFKHLSKFFNKEKVPWVDLTWKAYYSADIAPQARSPRGSFWWRALCRLFDQFR
jgi:hypothetical protein